MLPLSSLGKHHSTTVACIKHLYVAGAGAGPELDIMSFFQEDPDFRLYEGLECHPWLTDPRQQAVLEGLDDSSLDYLQPYADLQPFAEPSAAHTEAAHSVGSPEAASKTPSQTKVDLRLSLAFDA